MIDKLCLITLIIRILLLLGVLDIDAIKADLATEDIALICPVLSGVVAGRGEIHRRKLNVLSCLV